MRRGRGGRGSGGRGSVSASSVVTDLPVDFDIRYEFDIYTLRGDGETPTTFSEAIENFKLFVGRDFSRFDFTDLEFQADSPLNLQARFITAGEPITLDGQPLTNVNSSGGCEYLVAKSDRIEYRFFNEELTAAGIDEFTIAIEDNNTEQPGFQVDGQTIDIALATASGGISESDAIDYIITEELFASVNLFRVSGGSIDDPSQIISVELSLDNDEENPTEFTAFTPKAVDDSANTKVDTPVTIDVLANDNVG